MNRRQFAAALASAATLRGQSPAPRPRFWEIATYKFRQGSQGSRLHEHASKALIPAVQKIHSGPVLALDSLVAPHMPQILLILGFNSWEEIQAVHSKASADAALRKSQAALDAAPEPAYDSQQTTLLEAAPYQPEVKLAPVERPRIFELRVYHSPTWTQLAALHERFAGPEIKIFHRVGIHPVLYGTTIAGPDMPNLTYLIPFENLAAREKAWGAFSADAEWRKVRADSIAKSGQITSVIQISLFRAAAYSPIR